ncbi:DNA-processing protein DprA [Magnetococcus marinus]|uniref:DNA-processing protein DprA n=1 Tax=Magnetococcus marinus TaxID=1124597 RepID=UPI00135F1412|nr:DNA-processing protein DprA [Magnetococcus marinus]
MHHAWLQLMLTPGLGPISLLHYERQFATPHAILRALPRLKPELTLADASWVERLLTQTHQMGATALHWREPAYPQQLLEISDPPPLLFIQGDGALLNQEPLIAMVGTRRCSRNGERFAHKLAADLGQMRLTTVSGLAVGIDSAAHAGSLLGGGATVAVLGCGLDVSYPKPNMQLKAQIIRQGCLVSEYPPGTQPHPKRFPRRNRIISGLSRGVVVVEGGLKSGSLITARMALEQNREVFAVPGAVDDERSRGVHQLLKEGATLVESAADVVQALAWGGVVPEQAKRVAVIPSGGVSEVLPDIPGAASVVAALGDGALTVDGLLRLCHLTPAELSSTLLQLELCGIITREMGGTLALVPQVS